MRNDCFWSQESARKVNGYRSIPELKTHIVDCRAFENASRYDQTVQSAQVCARAIDCRHKLIQVCYICLNRQRFSSQPPNLRDGGMGGGRVVVVTECHISAAC